MSTSEHPPGQSGEPRGTNNQSDQILSRRELLFGVGGSLGLAALGGLGIGRALTIDQVANADQQAGMNNVGVNDPVARADLATAQANSSKVLPDAAIGAGVLTAGVAIPVGLVTRRLMIKAAANSPKKP